MGDNVMALGRFIAILICFLGLAAPAQAVMHYCSGTVSIVVTTWGGQVLTNIGHGLFGVCDIEDDSPHTSASKETCGAWYATLIAAKSTGTPVQFALNTTDAPNATMTGCADLGNPAWVTGAPNTLYVPDRASGGSPETPGKETP